MRVHGQLVCAQLVGHVGGGGRQQQQLLGTQVHRDPGGAVRQRRDPVPGQAAHPDPVGGTGHVLRAVAGHHRQPDVVQGIQPGVPHHVPVHRPHAADRAELRLRRGRAPAVGAHRPADVRPGEHPAVRPRQPVQAQPEPQAPAGARPAAARQVAHIATVLLRTRHQRRVVRPVPVPIPAEPRVRRAPAPAARRRRRRDRPVILLHRRDPSAATIHSPPTTTTTNAGDSSPLAPFLHSPAVLSLRAETDYVGPFTPPPDRKKKPFHTFRLRTTTTPQPVVYEFNTTFV